MSQAAEQRDRAADPAGDLDLGVYAVNQLAQIAAVPRINGCIPCPRLRGGPARRDLPRARLRANSR